jgi:hypothetical protein
MRLKMAFVGTALGLFGYMLIFYFSLLLFIIPGAWGLVALYSWLARNTQVQDGSTLSFVGTPGQFLKLLLAAVSVPIAVTMVIVAAMMNVIDPQTKQIPPNFIPFFMLMYLIIFVWSFYWGFKVLKWGIGSIRFAWGGQLEFTGGIFGYIGWILLMYISAILIIAPFWVMNALFKWMAEKTTSTTADKLIWMGSGWELLWRSIVAYLGCIFIVTIPWVMRWYIAWMVSMVEIERPGGSVPAYAPDPAAPRFIGQAPVAPVAPVAGGRYGGAPSSGPAPSSGSSDPGLFGPGT